MNNLRYILISMVLGGGFGAKIGAFISLNADQPNHDFINMGFISGLLLGVFAVAISLLISAINADLSQKRQALDKGFMTNSQ